MKERRVGPRFHQKTVVPEVFPDMELVKFHGEPALIPANQGGEPMYGRTRFTVRQAAFLIELERERIERAMAAQQL